MVVIDDVNLKGLTYVAGYSSNFTDRSLVDKEYADLKSYLAQNVQTTGLLTGGDITDLNTNDNNAMGLFVDWRKPLYYLYAQWLVDDISLDFLIPTFLRDELGSDRRIPQKWAWSLGGYYEFPFGRLGFYHAGATKYTFQA